VVLADDILPLFGVLFPYVELTFVKERRAEGIESQDFLPPVSFSQRPPLTT
jgi:hypothetical protein